MHPEIAVLATNQNVRLNIDEVYNMMVEKISIEGGSYQVPALSVLAQGLSISHSALGKYLRKLVSIGLLAVDKSEAKKKWRFATYRLPEAEPILSTTELEEQVETPQVDGGTVDDFKPLAALELDGWELVDEKGEKWMRGTEIASHLGYEREDAIAQIYGAHESFFQDGKDTLTLKLRDSLGRERETRVFSFTGGLKVCRYSEMPKADEVMQQLIDLADKVRHGKYPAQVYQINEHIAMWQEVLLGKVLLPKFEQIDSNIIQVKQEVQQQVTEIGIKVEDVTEKINNLVNQDVINDCQRRIDQYRKIVTWLRYWEMGYDYPNDRNKYGEVSRSLCWKLKHDYGLPDNIPVTKIPSHLQNRIVQDLQKSVFVRLEKRRPTDFYKLEEGYQKFLISEGFPILDISEK